MVSFLFNGGMRRRLTRTPRVSHFHRLFMKSRLVSKPTWGICTRIVGSREVLVFMSSRRVVECRLYSVLLISRISRLLLLLVAGCSAISSSMRCDSSENLHCCFSLLISQLLLVDGTLESFIRAADKQRLRVFTSSFFAMATLIVCILLLLFLFRPVFSVREAGGGHGRRGVGHDVGHGGGHGGGRGGRRGGGRGEGLGRFRAGRLGLSAGRLGRGRNGGVLPGRLGARGRGQNDDAEVQNEPQEGEDAFNDAFAVLTFGLQIVGFRRIANNRTSNDRFRAHYGISAKAILAMYLDLGPAETSMKNLLIALNWLKSYEVEHCMSSRWDASEQTLREKVREYVGKIRALKTQKVSMRSSRPCFKVCFSSMRAVLLY
jgi:hypothetical protein